MKKPPKPQPLHMRGELKKIKKRLTVNLLDTVR